MPPSMSTRATVAAPYAPSTSGQVVVESRMYTESSAASDLQKLSKREAEVHQELNPGLVAHTSVWGVSRELNASRRR